MSIYTPRIAVFGDLMLDINTYSTITKIANEAPIPVFNKQNETYHLGGAGNVLKNLAALECSTLYSFGIVGNDTNGNRIQSLCHDIGIINCIHTISDYNTIVKHRYFCDNKIIFRCDTETKHTVIKIDNAIIQSQFETLCASGLDCVVLSDYNKGFLNLERSQMIINIANKYNIPTIVDPKEDYHKYIGCTLIKPNRLEAYRIFNIPQSTKLEDVHQYIKSKIGCKYSVITLAEDGISVSTPTEYIKTITQAQQTIDVTGAGDIVTAIFSFFLASSKPLSTITNIATKIATISVQHASTYTIQKSDLYQCELGTSKLIGRDQLALLSTIYSDKKIVFTNGCFDLLHSGHMELFKFCREKGGPVIVGLNSDNSIRRLKGISRPVNPQKIRIDLLEAISYIDYIIIFDEDTPEELLKILRPYYLIKGGDYKPESIIGSQYAIKTLVCNLLTGMSSSNIINKIQSS
jgi:D-beta-D-heptose 7-phosphate kinase/D-beta-D-heptose 1-phosphate adenosyltransferase